MDIDAYIHCKGPGRIPTPSVCTGVFISASIFYVADNILISFNFRKAPAVL